MLARCSLLTEPWWARASTAGAPAEAPAWANFEGMAQRSFPLDIKEVATKADPKTQTFEITFNKTKYDALPPKMRAIIANAVEASSADMSWKAIDRYSKDYIELQSKDKVKFYKTPDSVLQAQLNLWDAIVEKKSGENPLFKEIVASQRAFAERAVKWDQDTYVSRPMAVGHFFGGKAPAAKKG